TGATGPAGTAGVVIIHGPTNGNVVNNATSFLGPFFDYKSGDAPEANVQNKVAGTGTVPFNTVMVQVTGNPVAWKSWTRTLRTMRYRLSTRGVVLAALLTTAVLLDLPSVSFAAPPAVGPDCGTGASIVGSDSAGKVTLGTGANPKVCTLVFASTQATAPACVA